MMTRRMIALGLILLTMTAAAGVLAGTADSDKPIVSITPYLGSGFWADDVGLDHYGLDLVWELMPRSRSVPYLTGGWAKLDYNAEGVERTQVLNGAEIDLANSEILAEIGDTLGLWPELRIRINGHTDTSGYEVAGKGEEVPIADNATDESRQLNRRVEFVVLNTEQLKREIEHRKLMER